MPKLATCPNCRKPLLEERAGSERRLRCPACRRGYRVRPEPAGGIAADTQDGLETQDLSDLQEAEASESKEEFDEAVLPTIPGYDVQAELGRGGMGVVYRVRQQSTGSILALKILLCRRNATFQELARFRIEAEALACLDHPNIVKI